MHLIKKYLPDCNFKEVHFCDVAAKPAKVIEAATEYRPENDRFFRNMIGLREFPMRIGGRLWGHKPDRPQPFGLHNFILLEKQDGNELAYGLVGRFWRPDFGLITMADGEAFRLFNNPDVPKLALCFSATQQKNGMTRLVTETRVFCPNLASRLKFASYWYLIRPVSGMIRGRILNYIKNASESASRSS